MTLEQTSAELVRSYRESGDPALHETTPGIARLGEIVMAGVSGPGADVGSVEEHHVGHDAGTVRVRVLKPHGVSAAVVVYFHGGGWVLGDIDLQHDHVGRDLANEAGVTVVMVNYRKAPEHPYPTALRDGWAALQWAAERTGRLAADGAPVVLAGDSAGGNLAAVLARWARDAGGPDVRLQVLVYPVTDCDLDTPSYSAAENQLLLTRDGMGWFWDHYLPDRDARRHPDASPLRATDLRGLPPALVYVAQYDPLRDEGVAYAEALAAAGVEVTLAEATGEMHTFFQMAGVLPGYATGIGLVAAHLRRTVGAVAQKVSTRG
ncbi:alpha/beta hydrolase [Jatrophihabitans fulvus]